MSDRNGLGWRQQQTNVASTCQFFQVEAVLARLSSRREGFDNSAVLDRPYLIVLKDCLHRYQQIKNGSTSNESSKQLEEIEKILQQAKEELATRMHEENKLYLMEMPDSRTLQQGMFFLDDQIDCVYRNRKLMVALEDMAQYALDWVNDRNAKKESVTWEEFRQYCIDNTTFDSEVLEYFSPNGQPTQTIPTRPTNQQQRASMPSPPTHRMDARGPPTNNMAPLGVPLGTGPTDYYRNYTSGAAGESPLQHHRQQMMFMHSNSSSGSLSNSSYPYANIYGGVTTAGAAAVIPPPPPPPQMHPYYQSYGVTAPTQPAYNPSAATSSSNITQHHPSRNRARSWSGGASLMDQQQQAQWIAAMQVSPQNATSFHSESASGYGGPQLASSRQRRHRRANSSSSVFGSSGGVGAASSSINSGAQFSPRSEFMKLANVRPGSPRGSPRQQYGGGLAGTTYAASHLQVPMVPPPQAYESMYDTFERRSHGNGRTSPYTSPERRVYGGNNGNTPSTSYVIADPAVYGSTNSIGSSGGEAVFLAQHARAIGSHSNGLSSSRKRHMRQKSVQLYMQDIKGVQQPPACRDVFFLLLFVFHLFGMVLLSNMYAYVALEHPEDDGSTAVSVNYQNLLIIAGCCGAFAIAVSTILLGVMSYFARNFVQVALIMAIALSFVWGTLGIGLSPQNLVPITGIVALALTVAYAIIVWDRVPFSTANLLTALSAIREHPTTLWMTVVSQLLGLGWSIYFAVVCCGIYDAIEEGRINVSHRIAVVIYVLLGVSYYWTIQVFLNVVQVATAGVIGEWWYQSREEDGIVQKSTFNTIFYSMGSICFGSLFMGPVKIIRQLSVLFRPSSDEASLLLFHECLHCIQTCITGCVEGLVDHFNPWGFAYVGLYGYAFPKASFLATELFAKRGWTTIVSDDLVANVLLMTSVVVGGVAGCVGYVLAGMERLHVTSLDTPGLVAFFVGLVVGLVLTSILFGAINGSVNAVIILFATSPVDFEENHQTLSREMRSAWREVWPGCVDEVDAHLAIAAVNGSGGHSSSMRAATSMGASPLHQAVPVPPPPPMVPEYAQIAKERTPLLNGRQ